MVYDMIVWLLHRPCEAHSALSRWFLPNEQNIFQRNPQKQRIKKNSHYTEYNASPKAVHAKPVQEISVESCYPKTKTKMKQ